MEMESGFADLQDRTIRSSTKEKTQIADELRKRLAASKSHKSVRAPMKHKFTQKELLLDALVTEVRCRRPAKAYFVCCYSHDS